MENEYKEIALFILISFYIIFSLVITIISFFIMSRIFKKANKPEWKAYVPCYNMWVLLQILYGDDRVLKLFIILFLTPEFGWFWVPLLCYRLGQVFGKDQLFCILNIFIGFITGPMLAFGNDKYIGPIEKTLIPLD